MISLPLDYLRQHEGGVVQGDCLEEMAKMPAAAFSMVLADLPYGTTQNRWDAVIPFDAWWAEVWRVLAPGGVAVLTAAMPFAALAVASQLRRFRHDWVWEKTAATGHLNAKRAPLRAHELVLVFCRRGAPYRPEKTSGHAPVNRYTKHTTDGTNYGATRRGSAAAAAPSGTPVPW